MSLLIRPNLSQWVYIWAGSPVFEADCAYQFSRAEGMPVLVGTLLLTRSPWALAQIPTVRDVTRHSTVACFAPSNLLSPVPYITELRTSERAGVRPSLVLSSPPGWCHPAPHTRRMGLVSTQEVGQRLGIELLIVKGADSPMREGLAVDTAHTGPCSLAEVTQTWFCDSLFSACTKPNKNTPSKKHG